METFYTILIFAIFMIYECSSYYVVYLEGYPGNLKLIEFSVDNPQTLNLNNAIDITPNSLITRCGNPDVSPDGTQIVFGAITASSDSWDIYIGDLNIQQGTIDNLQLLIDTDFREEDPRYSYDGNSFVYKSGKSWITPIVYDILIYDLSTDSTTTHVYCPSNCDNKCSNCNHCELWGPAYHPCGNKISYTARMCENGVDYDEIYIYDITTQQSAQVTDNSIPDMYSHWKRDGTLLFSRKSNGKDNLYLYDPETMSTTLELDITTSDDDPYAFKQDNNLYIFIGLGDSVSGYELYLVKNGNAIALTSQSNILGPVVFDLNIAVTIPAYCTNSNPNPTTTKSVTTSYTETTNSIGSYYIVYLEGYPGKLKLIELPVDNPQILNLNNAIDITPNSLINRCGNPDISPDGTQIIFGAITAVSDSWDIYIGDLNIQQGRIDNLQLLINTDFREEDPRYSYDGNSFVYKSGKSWITPVLYDILMYDFTTSQVTNIVQCPSDCDNICSSNCNHCELWGPAYHPCGNKISYTARICENDVNYDEVYIYDMTTQTKTKVTDNSIPDMYSHWKRDGTLLFSRKYNGKDNLYLYDSETMSTILELDITTSDDDPYAFKQDNNLYIFIGLGDSVSGYELYLVKNGNAIPLTSESSILGPVVFSRNIEVTIPGYCTGSNPATTGSGATTTESGTATTETTTTKIGPTINSGSNTRTQWIWCLLYAIFLCIVISFV